MSALIIIMGLVLGCGPESTNKAGSVQAPKVEQIRDDARPGATPTAPARPTCSAGEDRPRASAKAVKGVRAKAAKSARSRRAGLAARSTKVPQRGAELTKKRHSGLRTPAGGRGRRSWVPEPVRPSFTGLGALSY